MSNRKFIYIATKEQMNDPVNENHLWTATCDIKLSRRKLLDDIARTIYDHKDHILFKEGRIWPVPDVYELFGGIDGRWISCYRKRVGNRPRHKPHSSTLERRRVLQLYFRLRHPKIAKQFNNK